MGLLSSTELDRFERLPFEVVAAIDEVSLRFENELKSGRHPGIANYLDPIAGSTAQRVLFRELLKLELEYRNEHAAAARESVLASFPLFEETINEVFDEREVQVQESPAAGQERFQQKLPSAIARLPVDVEVPLRGTDTLCRWSARVIEDHRVHKSTTDTVQSTLPEQQAIELTVLSGPHAGEVRSVVVGELLFVGRAEDVQWRLPNEPYLSRHHFCIEATRRATQLLDLGTTNGTSVNGHRVRRIDLRDGDRIECGPTVIVVQIRTNQEISG